MPSTGEILDLDDVAADLGVELGDPVRDPPRQS
jgi:hypothetical protein